jgi:hypothetical protein
MHFCFLDESGHPPKPDANKSRPYFVIAGVIMHESQWHEIAKEIRAICAKPEYRITGEIKWQYFGAHNSNPDNSVAHLDQGRRDTFRYEFFDVIRKRKSAKIIACVSCVEAAYETTYVNTPEELYHYTYKPVSERFQYHLQDMTRLVGDAQLGLVVCDHRGRKQDDTFRKKHLALVEHDNLFVSTYANFVESVFLTPSHHSVGIQVADMIAGAVGRKFNNDDSKYFDHIAQSFRQDNRGNINGYGLVKFPKATWR